MWYLQQVWTSNCGLHNRLSCSNLASGVIFFEHRSRCLPHLILDIQRNAGKRIVFTHEKFNTCQFLMNVSRMFHSNILNKVVHTGLLRPHTESHYWCKFSISYCCILLFWNDNQNMTQLVESLLKRRAS